MVFQFIFVAIISLATICLVVSLVKSLWPRVQKAWLAQVSLIQSTNTKYSSVNSVLELLHTLGNQLSQVDAWKFWRLQRRKVVKEEEELCQICHDNFHPGDEVFLPPQSTLLSLTPGDYPSLPPWPLLPQWVPLPLASQVQTSHNLPLQCIDLLRYKTKWAPLNSGRPPARRAGLPSSRENCEMAHFQLWFDLILPKYCEVLWLTIDMNCTINKRGNLDEDALTSSFARDTWCMEA